MPSTTKCAMWICTWGYEGWRKTDTAAGGVAATTGGGAAELSGRIRHLRFWGGCGSMTEHRRHGMPGVLWRIVAESEDVRLGNLRFTYGQRTGNGLLRECSGTPRTRTRTDPYKRTP